MPNTVVVVDSGPLVALFDRGDASHERAVAFVNECESELVTQLAVVTEVMYLLRYRHNAQLDFLRWVSGGGVLIKDTTTEDLFRARQLIEKYADRPMDFADALLVALCERLDVPEIATIDSDFEIYRFKGRRRFVNLF